MKWLRYCIALSVVVGLSSCGSEEGEAFLFKKLNPQHTHIDFINSLEDEPVFNVLKYGYFYNGGGVATADFNNDGYLDLYFTGNVMQDQLYLNNADGTITFENITSTAGVATEKGWKTGVTVVDINDDGWMDIYVCRSAAQKATLRKNLLYINKGNNTFQEAAAEYGLDDSGYSTQAAFFDFDRDGDLDCFVLNHSIQKYAGFNKNLAAYKRTADPRYSSKLFKNDGGKYVDITQEAGLMSNILSFGLGVMVSDYNDDGWLDIYVSNDYNEEDYLYLNTQKGGFVESIREATAHTPLFSMGVDAADINNDAKIDLMTLDMLPASNYRLKMTAGDDNYAKYKNLLDQGFHKQYMRNMLQVNRGVRATDQGLITPVFAELGQLAGVSNTDWSWSALLADFDLDGHKDLLVTNGYEKDYTNMDFLAYTADLQMKTKHSNSAVDQLEVIDQMPAIKVPNRIFKNNGNLQFSDMTQPWGLQENTVSSGAIYADLDNDGDLDLAINNVNDVAAIYENTTPRQSFKVDLRMTPQALIIGAKVGVFSGDRQQWQEYIPTRGFQSAAQQSLVFARSSQGIDSVVIRWADGRKNTFHKIDTTQIFFPKYTPQTAVAQSAISPHGGLDTISYVHRPLQINDFNTQPLLPFMQSDRGPQLASNGRLLMCGGNQHAPPQLFTIDGEKIQSLALPDELNQYSIADITMSDTDHDGDTDIWVGCNGYYNIAAEHLLYYYDNMGGDQFTQKSVLQALELTSIGALATVDFNADGYQDLVIGGGVRATQYPLYTPSYVCMSEGGDFSPARCQEIDLGLVRDIVAWQENGQGQVAVAAEWQAIRQLSYEGDSLTIKEIGPSGYWQTIALDTLGSEKQLWIGNLGLNNQLAAITDHGLGMYAIEQSGATIPLLTYFQEGIAYPFAARDELLSQMPKLKKQYTTYDLYAQANTNDLLGSKSPRHWSATELRNGLLQKSKTEWHFTPLPQAAQQLMVRAIVPSMEGVYLLGNQHGARVRIGDLSTQTAVMLPRASVQPQYITIAQPVSSAILGPHNAKIIAREGASVIRMD